MVLGATATSTAHDAHLSNLIRRASRWVESYVGYPPTLQSYQETVASFGMRTMKLARTPVTAVDRVFDATDTGTATVLTATEFRVEDADAGLLSRDIGWPWSATLQGRNLSLAIPLEPAPVPGDEYKPWLVDYRAGWTYGGVDTGSSNWSTANGTTSTGRTLPEDVEAAALLRAQAMYEGIDLDGVVAERLGDIEVTYRGNARAMAQDAPTYEQLLWPYRRLA